MVARLHAAGLEVILDVVYNHTAEGNELGPTLSFKGIDNASYYRLLPDDPRYYINDTGTGNTLNLSHPRVLQMVTDSLRYWVEDMHVDGFRFDLGTILAREPTASTRRRLPRCRAARIRCCRRQADRRAVGLRPGRLPGRALPAGLGGVERPFPRHHARLLEGRDGNAAELATRLTASADSFNQRGRKPWASVNFLTAHDGFTLNDLVTLQREAQRRQRRGQPRRQLQQPVLELRRGRPDRRPGDQRAARTAEAQHAGDAAVLAGLPMLLAGDEFGRTQDGNNNAYCQDNEISWVNWDLDEAGHALLRLCAEADAAAPGLPDPAPRAVPQRPLQRGARRQGRDLAEAERRRDRRRRLVGHERAQHGGAARRAGAADRHPQARQRPHAC